MILLTVGTQGPFDRLTRAVDAWCAAGTGPEIFGQIGALSHGNYKPRHFEWVERLSPHDFDERFAQAELIVSHAGMGSIISALQAGKQIVIMPRRTHLREHRNDHQVATVQKMADRSGVHVAQDENQIAACIEQALERIATPSNQRIGEFADETLIDALRTFILGKQERAPRT